MDPGPPNGEQAAYWNGDEAAHWLVHETRYEAMLGPFIDHLLRAAAVGRGDGVLDVGCGGGATTCAAGRRAADGAALGVDLSGPLIGRARERAAAEGLANVRFELADVQVHPFTGAVFDAVISRFGVMFFDDPVAAFANMAQALRPDGRLAVVCWADAIDNEWLVVPGAAAAKHVAFPDVGDPSQPGPFSLGDRHRLSAVLARAGLRSVAIEALSVPLTLGSDVADVIRFLVSTGIGQRLLAGADEATMGRVTEAMAVALEPHRRADGVTLGSKSWLVTARAPS